MFAIADSDPCSKVTDTPESSALIAVSTKNVMPSPGCLALHHHHQVYTAFQDFQADLPTLFAQALYLEEAERAIRTLGILEPLTGRHLPPEELLINGSNYRESIVGRGCLSRHRALIMVLQQVYGNQEALGHQAIYLSEALTGFSRILQEWSPQGHLEKSTSLPDSL